MKYIIKGDEPQEFVEWKASENENWRPKWGNIGNIKKPLQNALLEEQGFICCYCEKEIDNKSSHVEHIKPRHAFENDRLNYQNLLCSCGRNLNKKEPKTCGHAKENWYDDTLFISPLSSDCESRFKYSNSGEIKASGEKDNASEETIKRLNLNLFNLIKSRKNVIDVHITDTSDDLNAILEMKDGKYQEFHTTIKQFFNL